MFDIPKNSIGSVSPLSIRTKFVITVTVLSSLSFKVTGTSVYHPNELVICLKLPFMAKLDGLSAFHSSALIAEIGRASCRERGKILIVDVSCKREKVE